MAIQTFIATLVIEDCCNCGIAFGMSADFAQRRRDDHKTFYCPAGHPQHYTGKSETEKLKDQLQSATNRENSLRERNESLHDQLLHKNYSIRALKAAKTKVINRVKNGVCPCCNRTFKNLQDHFQSKHPELFESGK